MEQEQDKTMTDEEIKETEQVELEGEKYQVSMLADGKIEIEVPEGLNEEDREKFVSDIQEKSRTVGSYYKKLSELNLERQNPAWLKFKEAYEKGELTKEDTPDKEKTEPNPADKQPKEKALWEELGLHSEHDLEDYIVDHPIEYAKALENHIRKAQEATVAEQLAKREEEVTRKAAEISLESTIKGSGHDPAEVRAYARFNNMPFGDRAYELYRLEHAPKVDPAIEARIKAQKEQITFVNRGTRSKVLQADLPSNELPSLSAEQLAARKKYYMELASRG